MSIVEAKQQLAEVSELERKARLPVDGKLEEWSRFQARWQAEYDSARDAWSPLFQRKEELENFIRVAAKTEP